MLDRTVLARLLDMVEDRANKPSEPWLVDRVQA